MKPAQYLNTAIRFIFFIIIFQSCNETPSGKIKLSQGYIDIGNKPKTTLTTLQVFPKEKQNIVIFKFKNNTKDTSLDWLQRGLIDLFSYELSQSPYLNIVNSARINVLIKETMKNPKVYKDIDLTVARKVNAQIILNGQYYYEGDSLCIDVELRSVKSGKLFKMETIRLSL